MRRDVFQAIADPTRRDILGLLSRQSLTPNAVADSFGISRQAVSKHIKILTECGLVHIEPKGRERLCTLEPAALSTVSDWIAPFRKLWEDKFDKLDQLLNTLSSEDNEN